ncbi:hypothetical protein [Pseudomonas aeruginosa]|uniref:hypothetical protein n=1 Tax=Pseudomonas aeruginosa TaxID=287 RepID=UPI000F53E0BF|nr:hypothetical protein [Pseudomonas aeruginosa]RQF76400.1 hypothetical protein IPC260_02565 [Pseudomonas aeruginosa]HDY5025905.1 hypothetical protein [Pseudomonas aeruginosa]
MPELEVKTLKGFINQGSYVKRGSTITVDELRARELRANGLIEGCERKQAPAPENKAAPAQKQKPAGKPKAKE